MQINDMVQKIKQTNVSSNSEVTQKRFSTAWKAATPEQKEAILRLASVTRATIERIYRKGAISVKLAVPIAETLQLNPFYLTAEEDEQGGYCEEKMVAFLTAHGYGDLLGESADVKPPAHNQENDSNILLFLEKMKISASMQKYINTLSEDDVVVLLKALLIRAKAGDKTARIAELVKVLLTM